MLFVSLFALLAVGFYHAQASPRPIDLSKRDPVTSEGLKDGFFYYYHAGGGENATWTNGDGSQFNLTFNSRAYAVIGGKGWKPGKFDRIFEFSGSYTNCTGSTMLGVYGRTTNPDIEYNIIEHFCYLNPSATGVRRGTVETDGSIYDLAQGWSSAWLPIPQEQEMIPSYWSVRRRKRTATGRIDLGAHFRAWEAAGMKLGANHEWQIWSCMGYWSDGNCTFTISEVLE